MGVVLEDLIPPSDLQPDTRSTDAAEALRADLDRCLSSIRTNDSFTLFETLSHPVNSGLCLKNGGPIGLLPLTERDARVIIAAGRRVPFEKGEQTPVNEQVRIPWQLLDSEFEIKNPAWEPFLQSIVREVCQGLGVCAAGNGVQAKLCKMLLYDPGSAFESHQE
jgi:hypothetical protein